jgi:hypothetical protein
MLATVRSLKGEKCKQFGTADPSNFYILLHSTTSCRVVVVVLSGVALVTYGAAVMISFD